MKMVVNGKVVWEFDTYDLDVLEETVPMDLKVVDNGDGTINVYYLGKPILESYMPDVKEFDDENEALWDELYWRKGIISFIY